MNPERLTPGKFFTVWAIMVGLCLTFWAVVAIVAVHFITKFW